MADRYNLTYSGEQVNTAIVRGLTSLQPTTQTLSDIQKQTVRTNIGAMGASNVYNPNLLINPDFAINQRGASSYTGANTYTVDRWIIWGSGATVSVVANGISFVTTTASRGIVQFIEDKDKLAGKTVTLSLTGTGGAGGVQFALKKRIGGAGSNIAFVDGLVGTTGTITLTTTIPTDLTNTDIYVSIYNKTAETSIFNSVKLELGSIATPFVPPLIAEELPKCQRYGIPIRLHGGANYATSTTSILCGIPLPSTLRTTPTIIVSTQPTVGGSGSTYTATNTTVNSTYSNEVILAITTSGITANEIYALQGGMAFLDAEIY